MSHVISRRGAISTAKGVEKTAETLTPWYVATKTKGVDNTGATDSRKGLIEAAETAMKKKKGLFVPAGTYLINSGTGFNLEEIPLAVLKEVERQTNIINWELYCSSNAKFLAGSALGNNPVLSLALAATNQLKFLGSFLKVGMVVGFKKEQVGIKLQKVDQSEIHVGLVKECSKGIYCVGMNEGLTQPSVADNTFFVGAVAEGGIAVHLESNNENRQCTANTFFLPEIATCETGIQTDTQTLAEASLANSNFNRFFCTVEQNTVQGILDFAPSNKWEIQYSNLNGPGFGIAETKEGPGYVVGKGMKAPGPGYVRGHVIDGCKLENLPERGSDIVNTAVEAGKAVIHKNEKEIAGGAFEAFEPAVPATETNVASPYERPAFVYIAPNTSVVPGEQGVLVEVNGVQYPLNLARLPEAEQQTIVRKKEATKVFAENANGRLQLTGARPKGWIANREVKYIGPGTAGGAFEVGKVYTISSAAINTFNLGVIVPKASEEVEVELLPDKPKTTNASTKLKLAKSKLLGYSTNPGAGVNAGNRQVKVTKGTGGFAEPEGKVEIGSAKMKEVTSYVGVKQGNFIVGAGVPSGTFVLTQPTAGEEAAKELTMSQNATATEAKGKYKFQALLEGRIFFVQAEVGTEEFTLSLAEASPAIEMKATEELEVELVSVTMHPRLAQFYRLLPGQFIKLKYEGAAPAWRWELST